jgi:cytochrome c peroxidase
LAWANLRSMLATEIVILAMSGNPHRVWMICTGSMLALLAGACDRPPEEPDPAIRELRDTLRREPPMPVPVPADNPQSPAKIALGEALFFDPNLSSCGTVACATCHLPERGFSDGRRLSRGCGDRVGRRNSTSLYGSAYLNSLFWDGRVGSLEEQALHPVEDPREMANSWPEVLHYLSTGEHRGSERTFPAAAGFYAKAFREVFGGQISSRTAAQALAAYQRTVVSADAPFDRWLNGEVTALSAAQKQGALIFFGRGRCSECHVPPAFTDSLFHNVGAPAGGFENLDLFPDNPAICGGVPGHVDPGRGEASLSEPCQELGAFRTPSLRNVEFSAPYMHNGVFSGLESVVLHYWNTGRGTTGAVVGELDPRMRLIRLTDSGGHPEDIRNLVEFLKALSGTTLEGPSRGIAPPGE